MEELAALLRHREAVIADHAWRDRDAAGHLAALADVSQAFQAWHLDHRAGLDPRLDHFLGNASFAKALALLDDQPRQKCGPR